MLYGCGGLLLATQPKPAEYGCLVTEFDQSYFSDLGGCEDPGQCRCRHSFPHCASVRNWKKLGPLNGRSLYSPGV